MVWKREVSGKYLSPISVLTYCYKVETRVSELGGTIPTSPMTMRPSKVGRLN